MSEESLCEEACVALRSKLAVAMTITTLVVLELPVRVRSRTMESFPTIQTGKIALDANQLMYRPRPARVKAHSGAAKYRRSAAEIGGISRAAF